MSPAVTIRDVRAILTQPGHSRLVIVKVETSEPGLYGLGCATFTQGIFAVQAALERHLRPFLIGRDVDRIEENWHMSMVHAYWRNGPVLNNAISGVDQALWLGASLARSTGTAPRAIAARRSSCRLSSAARRSAAACFARLVALRACSSSRFCRLLFMREV